jgi:anthranilate/para-aminobenzoate synthase component I
MKPQAEESYWDRAARFFRGTGRAGSAGSYFIHTKNRRTVKIGLGPQVTVAVTGDRIERRVDGRVVKVPESSPGPALKSVERLLRDDAPCFFLVSPDVVRRAADPALPQILVVQPSLEFSFSPERSEGEVSYARDAATAQHGRWLLDTVPAAPHGARTSDRDDVPSFAELIEGWTADEDDESFSHRLRDAIQLLRGHDDGKLTLTRGYDRRVSAGRDPYHLYELHAWGNGEYACSHFACLREGTFSLGVTPENVFEVDDRLLTVDVVAATCKSSDNPEEVARELSANPKQVKEHRSSLGNRQNRFRAFCEEASLEIVQEMQVKQLRNVFHLHSVFTGTLRPAVTVFDLMADIFPLLGARPQELRRVADPERTPHRYYGGVVGHVHLGVGGAFLNIRNALLDGGVLQARVGVGVIAESDAHDELLETRNKLSGLLEAVYRWDAPGSTPG